MKTSIVLAAAGTAGHIYPAVAVAQSLVESGFDTQDVSFVTSTRAIETEIFKSLDFQRTAISLDGVRIKRPWTIGAFLFSVMKVVLLLRRQFRQGQTKLVVVFGGYISTVAAIAAKSLGIPIIVVETNSVMGKANSLAAAFATKTFRSFNTTANELSTASGVPLRNSVKKLSPSLELRQHVLENLGLSVADHGRFIVVFGGSLGALKINDATVRLLEAESENPELANCAFYLVTGMRDFDMFKDRLQALRDKLPGRIAFSNFDSNLVEALAVCDLVVCRAGSNTIAELSYFGVPAVLIPLPNAPKDHQTKNALWYRSTGRAAIVEDGKCDSSHLRNAIGDESLLRFSYDNRCSLLGESKSSSVDVGKEIAGTIIGLISPKE